MLRFRDRRDAGRCLGRALRGEFGANVVVLGLARGGVPVAYEVARLLKAPIDVLVVRKLEVASQEDLAAGAVANVGREEVRGRRVIVVDDGLGTGASLRVAIAFLRVAGAVRITVAVPAGSPETCRDLRADADDVFCLTAAETAFAVGLLYDDLSPTSDEEMRDLLDRGAKEAGAQPGPRPRLGRVRGRRPKLVKSDLKDVTPGRAGAAFPHDRETVPPSRGDRWRRPADSRSDGVPRVLPRPDPERRGGHDRSERRRTRGAARRKGLR